MPAVVARPRARSVSERLIWPFVLGSSAVAVALVVVSTRHGPGLSVDSTVYLSTARNVADGRGLVAFNDELLTIFPPGLPLGLAMLMKVGTGTTDAARYVNAVALGAIVVLSYLLLRRHVRSPAIVAMATALIALSPALFDVSSMAWSEPLFVVVTIAFLLGLETLHESHAHRLPLFLGSVSLVWLGFMVRYAGIALAVVGVVVLLAVPAPSALRRVGRAAAFGALSLAVPAVWMIRYVVVGTGPVGRLSSTRGVATNARDGIEAASTLLLPERAPSPLRVLVLVVSVAVAVGGARLVVHRGEEGRRSARALVPVVTLAIVYPVVVIVSASVTSVDRLGARLLSPVVVPVVVLVAWIGDQLRDLVRVKRRRMAQIAITGVLGVWLVGSLARTVDIAAVRARDGAGYASSQWRRSQLMAAVARAPDRALVYSNDPFAVFAVTGRQPVYTSPRRVAGRPIERTNAVVELVRRACGRQVFLAWATGGENPLTSLLTPSELRRVVVLERVATTKDGVLFRVTPNADAQARSCPAE